MVKIHHGDQACVTKLLHRGAAKSAFQADRSALSETTFRLTLRNQRLVHFCCEGGARFADPEAATGILAPIFRLGRLCERQLVTTSSDV